MRAVTGMSGLMVCLSLIVMIHCSIVNRHVRDVEVSNGLESSMDYATDRLRMMYKGNENLDKDAEKVKNEVMQSFCEFLKQIIVTDGEIHVKVTSADMETGSFDFIVEEIYEYGFAGRKGIVRCERAICLYE